MRHRFFLPVLLALAVGMLPAQQPASPPPARVPLDIFLGRANPWEAGADNLAPYLTALRFGWVSQTRDTMRSDLPGMKFRNLPVSEVVLRFSGGKLNGSTLFFFNRGDGGEMREADFEKLLTAATGELNALTGRAAQERGRDAGSAVRAEGRVWETKDARYVLEWSAIKGSRAKMIPFRAEFIRLVMQPRDAAAPGAVKSPAGKFVGRDHVARTPEGDVVIRGVPMVDQGNRGYCVVANAERVMRYYGVEVDQHELAQIGNAGPEGVSSLAFMESLRKLTGRLKVTERTLCEWNLREFLKIVEDYNRATRRGKLAPEIKLDAIVDVERCYLQVNPGIYRDVRLKMTSDYGKFQREIQRSIDEGIPVIWTVQMGLVEERGMAQARGGHARLIIGYNPKTKEVIYSDSWGAGHEQKRMSMDDAWTMTMGLQAIQPTGS